MAKGTGQEGQKRSSVKDIVLDIAYAPLVCAIVIYGHSLNILEPIYPMILNIWCRLWWKYMPGEIIHVRWPNGYITVKEGDPHWDPSIGTVQHIMASADPNDHYRPLLEKNVGKQYWDWSWDYHIDNNYKDKVIIKFRKGKSKWASYFSLLWA